MKLLNIVIMLTIILVLVGATLGTTPDENPEVMKLEGWTVYVDRQLVSKKGLGSKATKLLRTKLYEIKRVLPAEAVKKLQTIPIWLSLNDKNGKHPCAVYHPSERWLKKNGYNPKMARCVEIANAENFLEWTITQPFMVLHELAHGYHHQFLGNDHKKLKAAYAAAVREGKYQSVLRYNGTKVKHYCLTNVKEYFAEATEAYFGTNDYFPFVRAELASHDPRIERLMKELWFVK